MKIVQSFVIPAAALGMMAFGASAVMAQGGSVPLTSSSSATTPEPSATSDTGKVSKHETQHFITEAAHANQDEIDEAHYAMDHTQSAEVKQFAQKMLEDHSKAGDQLKQIASSEGYKVPSTPSVTQRAALKMLEKKQGSAFDMAYSKSQDSDHRKVVAMFKRAADNPRIAPQVRDFAQMTLPVLEEHLSMAKKLVASVGGTRKAG